MVHAEECNLCVFWNGVTFSVLPSVSVPTTVNPNVKFYADDVRIEKTTPFVHVSC